MKNLIIIVLTSILTFLLITIIFFSCSLSIGEKINFSTKDGKFNYSCVPSKGRDYKMMISAFSQFKSKENLNDEIKIYRVSKKNYLNICKWTSYKTMQEWQHPTN